MQDVKTSFDGKRALVTGGAGFIGSHLCEALVAAGCGVTVLDDLSTGRAENLPGGVRFVNGSVSRPDVVADAVSGCDFVFHLAAMVSVPASIADPQGCFERNVVGTDCLVRAAARAGVAGFVHTSSSAVYGPQPCLPSQERDPIACASPYAASKACGELLVQAAALSSAFPGVSLRLFNVFGPLQAAGHAYAAVVPAFVDAALKGEPLQVHGDGTQSRDFTYVRTVTTVIADAVSRTVASPDPVNLAFGSRTNLLEVIALLEELLGRKVEVEFTDPRVGDVKHSQAENERLRALFPDVVPVDLRDGLTATLGWFQTGVVPPVA